MHVIMDVFSVVSPSSMALLPVVQEIQTKTHETPQNSKNVLFKPLALYVHGDLGAVLAGVEHLNGADVPFPLVSL
jgi:hypothetical protein